MKLTNRLAIHTLAGVAGLWLTGNALAADSACCATKAGCCDSAPPAATDAKPKPDLLTTCPVSGETLGEMGKPFTFVYKDQEVKLCCKNCKKKFDKDPEKYMAIIRAADKK
jgi:YHS domain-containing protein